MDTRQQQPPPPDVVSDCIVVRLEAQGVDHVLASPEKAGSDRPPHHLQSLLPWRRR
jgi:hypothetical protein